MSERLQKLMAMLEKQPKDAFLLYGIALEHKKAGDSAQGLAYLERAIAAEPAYCYAYYQKGLLLEGSGDVPAAREAYRAGIAAAEKSGDAHAREELAAALQMLE